MPGFGWWHKPCSNDKMSVVPAQQPHAVDSMHVFHRADMQQAESSFFSYKMSVMFHLACELCWYG